MKINKFLNQSMKKKKKKKKLYYVLCLTAVDPLNSLSSHIIEKEF